MKRMITCIVCPMGCTMAVEMNGEEITVVGNACPRGEKHAIGEVKNPVRSLTSIVRVTNREDTMVSVKSAAPVPKGKMFEAMEEIKHIRAAAPVEVGDIVCENLAGTGVPLIATKKVSK